MRFLRPHAALTAALALLASPAVAATQGTIGSTSTGSLGLALTIPSLVRITQVDDIALGNWTGAGALQGADSLCVFSTTRRYRVTATGSGAGGAFELAGGATVLPYAVQWRDVAGATSGAAMTAGTALNGQASATNSTICGGGTNATVIVIVAFLAVLEHGSVSRAADGKQK